MSTDIENNPKEEAEEIEKVDETANFEVVTDDAIQLPEADAIPEEEKQKQEDEDKAIPEEEKPKADSTNSESKTGRNRAKRRAATLTKRAKIAESKAEAETLRADNAEKKLKELNGGSDKEPSPDDFEDYDAYLVELEKFEKPDTKEEKKEEPKKVETEINQELDGALEDIEDSFNDMRKVHKDFDEVVISNDKVNISSSMVVALAETDIPGEIAYHLGSNPEEADAIFKLSQNAQIRAIAKLEVKLQATPARKVTNAPDPIKPSGGSSSTEKSEKDMDFSEFEASRNKAESKNDGTFW